jgi:hypothetical protein
MTHCSSIYELLLTSLETLFGVSLSPLSTDSITAAAAAASAVKW